MQRGTVACALLWCAAVAGAVQYPGMGAQVSSALEPHASGAVQQMKAAAGILSQS